jgi:hypothetical protein
MLRRTLLVLALTHGAGAAAQHACALRLEAALVDPVVTPRTWVLELSLRLVGDGVVLVKPECQSTGRVDISFRELRTGAVYTDVWGDGEECDVLLFPRVGSVVALAPGEALELRFGTRTPPPGEYEVTVSYRNEPGRIEGVCEMIRERPRSWEDEPWEREVGCHMQESTPCVARSAPFVVFVPERRAP